MRQIFQREDHMPRYLTLFEYSTEGAKGLLKEKAAAREEAVRNAYEGIGGKVEAAYWVRFKPMQGRFGLSDLAGGDGWRSGC
jgi:uncharacterized protein with GYD domain